MDQRSPLESIFSVMGNDKPVKHAVYNAVALFLLFLCCAAGYAVYMILEPFIKPLMWAVLVGSTLHPLKRSIQYNLRTWIKTMEHTNTPIVFGITLLPMNIFNYFSEFIGENLWKRLKLIVVFCIAVPVIHLMYFHTPSFVSFITCQFIVLMFKSLNLMLDNSSFLLVSCSITSKNYYKTVRVSLVLIGYISLVFLMWKPENNTKFHYASIVIWLLCSSCLSRQFAMFQLPIFIILQVIFFGGFLSEVYEIHQTMSKAGHPITLIQSLSLAFHDKPLELHEDVQSLPDTKVLINKTTNEDMTIKTTNDMTDKTTNEDKNESPVFEKKSKVTFKEKLESTESSGDSVCLDRSQAEIDPWWLELFEEKHPVNRSESELSKSSVLITNHGIHLIQQQNQCASISELLNKPKTSRKNEPILKRSLSQPQFFSNSPKLRKGTILSLSKKLNFNNSNSRLVESHGSTFYLYSILWACVVMLFWKNIMLLPLLPIPILFYIIKHVGLYLGLWNYLYQQCCSVSCMIMNWCIQRHDALVPVPIRGLYRFIHKVNVILKTSIENSIDTVASCAVILGLIVFLIIASIFIVFQIYAEAIMLVQMTGNVINQTVVNNPELKQMLPPAWDDTFDSILDNAYLYGREGISKAVKSMMSDVESSKSEKLEKQVLELWDRVYQNWMAVNDSNHPKVTDDAVRTSWEAFINDIQKSPEIFNLNGIMDFGKQNIDTLMSLLESVWSLLKGNISLILGSFSTLLSVILGGGTAVLNFILNVVVFLTTLFYLLNSSGDLYKPVEVLTNFSPSSRRFGHALEGAINGVFSASFKMAAFYGLWTWFIHNLFGVKIVYLPSVFAMILGAVPFLGTYWACIPAVLDLWLAQDLGIAAIAFAAIQFLPTSVVDTTIYKEIKGGGHPYLTGLAIAGGIFCLGVEGAIIGPMLLCGLYVAMDLSSTLFQESPSEGSLNLRIQQLQDSS